MRSGVLPDWRIKELIKAGCIPGADQRLVNTSSLDLRIGLEKSKLLGSFLPLPGQTIEDALHSRDIVDTSSKIKNFYLELLQPYAMKLVESLDLPGTISAKVFNKSGRARVGIAVKGLTDGTPHFDIVPHGYKGALYVEVSATSFPVVIRAGKTTIPQIRFYEGDPNPLAGSELELLLRSYPILTDDRGRPAYTAQERGEMIRTGKLTFTADLSQKGLLAYVANKDRRNFDLAKEGFYEPQDFFNEVRPVNGKRGILKILPGDFVLVKSRQHIRLPPAVAAEIDPYSVELGDMKTSYANLINTKHGWGSKEPSYIVSEIRAGEEPVIIQNDQQLAKISLYKMWDEPEGSYMDKKSTNYSDLRSILPSQFKKKEGRK